MVRQLETRFSLPCRFRLPTPSSARTTWLDMERAASWSKSRSMTREISCKRRSCKALALWSIPRSWPPSRTGISVPPPATALPSPPSRMFTTTSSPEPNQRRIRNRPSKRAPNLSRYNAHVNSYSLEQVASAEFPTRWGIFRIFGFQGTFGLGETERREEAVALVMGDVHSAPALLRIHSQCLTGDVFGSLRCDCRQQLEMALSMIAQLGAGVLIYEQQEGRGIGLM